MMTNDELALRSALLHRGIPLESGLLTAVNLYGQHSIGWMNLEVPQVTIEIPVTPGVPKEVLSTCQIEALRNISAWLLTTETFYVLKGFAGTGKTFVLKKILADNPRQRWLLTAPTNKAAAVLANSTQRPASTSYSALGLRMEHEEDRLVLKQGKDVYISRGSILVVDEASMVPKILMIEIRRQCQINGLRVLFVGDPLQLPPVDETDSLSFKSAPKQYRSLMRTVMRNDNQLLDVATKIRAALKAGQGSPVESNHDDVKGVWLFHQNRSFERRLLEECSRLDQRVVCWTNARVGYYNSLIRRHLGYREEYVVGEQILLAEPVEREGRIIAHTDDEYQVRSVQRSVVNILDKKLPTWMLELYGPSGELTVHHPQDPSESDSIFQKMAHRARTAKQGRERSIRWKEFWTAKARVTKVRYAYALTAHRAQGSTYRTVFADQSDILKNRNRVEAMRCLYVACTRPTDRLLVLD
jgi:exodeoxyribonuclease-5